MTNATTAPHLIDHETASRAADLGTVLGIWAHPDDEAYLSAGLMAAARAAGNRVVVATATAGELGTPDPGRWPPDRLGRERARELAASLAALDVREHHWLGHLDGNLSQVPERTGVGQVGRLLRRVRPDTIVTFGPDGLTGHTDHRTVSGWVTRAWLAAGRPGRLWHVSVTPEFHAEWGAVNADVNFFYPDADPPSEPAAAMACTVQLAGELLDRKNAALRAHTTQTAALIDRLGEDRYRRWWATEHFVDAGARIDEAAVEAAA